MRSPPFCFSWGESVHLLECPKKKSQMECQGKDGYERFVLFHRRWCRKSVLVRQALNAKSRAIRVLQNVIQI